MVAGMTPLVSALIPTFNSERTLDEALESVMRQTIGNVEVIVVDDGSSDGTIEVARRFEARHPGRVICLQQNHAGPYVARNLAAQRARGRYVAFLDSDDAWLPDKLARQIRVMEASADVVLCHTGVLVVDASGEVVDTVPIDPRYQGRCFPTLLVVNRLATSSVVMRRDVFQRLGGFDEAFPARGDWELWTRAARCGLLAAVNEPLIRYRMHPRRMSLDTDRMRSYHLAIIEKNARSYGDEPGLPRLIRHARAEAHLGYASDYLAAGRRREARRDVLIALAHRPVAVAVWKAIARMWLSAEVVDWIRHTLTSRRSSAGSAPTMDDLARDATEYALVWEPITLKRGFGFSR
jgi:glycosyltransferase involved in cell wall biosynthesis